MEDCYCCGELTENTQRARGFPGVATVALCPMCEGGTFIRAGGYLVFECPMHGYTNMGAMVRYLNAIDIFNDEYGTAKRGKRPGFGVDWDLALEELREEWLEKRKG